MIVREAFGNRTIHIDWRPPPPPDRNPFDRRDLPLLGRYHTSDDAEDSGPFLLSRPTWDHRHRAKSATVMAWRCFENTCGEAYRRGQTCGGHCMTENSRLRSISPLLEGSQFGALGFLLSCKSA